MEEAQIKAVVESLIFSSEGPLGMDRMREVLGEVSRKDLQRLLSEMMEEYDQRAGGFHLVEVAEGFHFRTRPEHGDWIRKLKKVKPPGLSQPALETLAIVAYRQPIVRTDVEKIRGVDSGGVLRTLLERKLVKILGKKDVPGKPLVYGTSKRFLEVFGLKDLSSLPTLKDLEGLGPVPSEEILPVEEENRPEAPRGEEAQTAPGPAAEEPGTHEPASENTEDPGGERDRLPQEG